MADWCECQRLMQQHLSTATTNVGVFWGDDHPGSNYPLVFLADTDGGQVEHSIQGARYFNRIVYAKVVAKTNRERETLMRALRQCWDKSTTAGALRASQLCEQGAYNIYPEGPGEKSLGRATKDLDATGQVTPETYEGLLTFTVWYEETPATA